MSKISSGAERLWEAIAARNMAIVREILESAGKEAREFCEAEVHTVFSKAIKSRDGLNCIHLAAKKGNVKALVEMFNKTDGPRKLNIEKKSSKLGWTPLHYATYCGHATIVKTLLIKDARINASTKDSKNALHLAMEKGYRKMAALLIMKQIDINRRDSNGLTALHYCVEEKALENKKWSTQDRIEMVEYLLMRGAEPEIQNNEGNCALHLAVQNNVEEETILMLGHALHREGMLGVTNKDNKTPIGLCEDEKIKAKLIEISKEEIKELTPASTPQITPTSTPIHTPVQIEVTPPPGPNQASAAISELPEAVLAPKPVGALIINVAGSPDKARKPEVKGRSTPEAPAEPPDGSTRKDRLSPAEKMSPTPTKDKNSLGSTTSLGGDGNTPMHLACKQYAINSGDVENGNTQIKGNLHYVQTLLLQGGFNGGDINKRNREGQTPLHISLKLGDLEMADFLVKHGANIHAMDLSGVTTKDLQPDWYNKKMDEAKMSASNETGSHKLENKVDNGETQKSSAVSPQLKQTPAAEGDDRTPTPDESGAYETDILANGPSGRFTQFTREPSITNDNNKPAKRPDSIMQDKKISYINHPRMNERLASTGTGNYQEALKVNSMMKVIGGVAGLYGPGLYVARDMTSYYGSSSKTPRQAKNHGGLTSAANFPGDVSVSNDKLGLSEVKPPGEAEEEPFGYITPRIPNGNDFKTTRDRASPPDGLKRELSRLQEDVSEMKEFLEELSSEGKGGGLEEEKNAGPKKNDRSLERQMTRLMNEVSEVRQELEEVSAETTTDLSLV